MPEATPREKELNEQLARAVGELADARTENQVLREKVDALIRRLFGAKSEKLDPAQLLLMLQGFDALGKSPEPVVAEEPRRSKGQSPPREREQPRLPGHLEVIEEVIVPEPVKAAPQDWRRIGEEVSERLDYEPARFLRRRTVRPNTKCVSCCPAFTRRPRSRSRVNVASHCPGQPTARITPPPGLCRFQYGQPSGPSDDLPDTFLPATGGEHTLHRTRPECERKRPETLRQTRIAAVLACTPKAVETRLYRARQTLREKLSRWLKWVRAKNNLRDTSSCGVERVT